MSPVDLPPVPAPDEAALAAARARRDRLPAGALGRWGAVLDQLAAVRGRSGPTRRPRLVVLAAEHGVAELGVSAYEPSATAHRAAALRAGAGAVSAVARAAGVGVGVCDPGDPSVGGPDAPDREFDAAPDPRDRLRVGPSGRIDAADALDEDEVAEAIARGRAIADREIDSGTDLLIGATCGVGVSTPSAVLLAAITGMEPVDATGRGSGIDDSAWITKAGVVRDALFRVHRAAGSADVPTLLRVAGGADLAALTGLIAQAAVRRTPVVVHDLPSAVAAVLAHRLAPGADTAMLALTAGSDRGTRRALQLLGLTPLTEWSGGDGGLGALLAVPALRAAETAAYGEPETQPEPQPLGAMGREPATGPDLELDAVRSPHALSAWDAELL